IEVFETIFQTLRLALFFLIRTPYYLLPSAIRTADRDDAYDRDLIRRLTKLVDELEGIDSANDKAVLHNWVGQIEWTNGRANRERTANELIRWWQIILSAIIPVLANIDMPQGSLLISVSGIFVAILTAIYQFRRPDERWRHYRMVHERYLMEIWSFIGLSGPVYGKYRTHAKKALREFNQHMITIRQNDVRQFFGEIVVGKDPHDLGLGDEAEDDDAIVGVPS
ncbi:MAG: DUF4231 domain-containing protein, partial [Anaerolineae bacterium]|nr:DUF4231 domain-containing protein [Anaerolineae bacterium]